MRGRIPSGPEYVESLEGSEQAKKRLRIVLETMTGRVRVQEACEILEISEQRFYQLREELLQAALERLESKRVGRPPRQAAGVAAEEPQQLREQVAELQMELQAAQLREEIALALPKLRQHAESVPESQKKTKRRARSGWWKK